MAHDAWTCPSEPPVLALRQTVVFPQKALSARRHGIKEFIQGMRSIPVHTLEEVLKVALPQPGPAS
jgi:hypothetical protein